MNTPVSFPIAKLLKEKGFEQKTKSYTEDGKLVTVSLTIRRFNPEKNYYPAPTIAEVVMWLYEKHGIWIVVNIEKPHLAKSCMFYGNVIKFGLHHKNKHRTVFYNSPTEAYEAAIEYTLNNLI